MTKEDIDILRSDEGKEAYECLMAFWTKGVMPTGFLWKHPLFMTAIKEAIKSDNFDWIKFVQEHPELEEL